MSKLRHAFLFIALALPFGTHAVQCQNLPGGVTGTYCVYPGQGQSNSDIVYFFPRENQNPSIWGDDTSYPQQVRDYWARQELEAPTIVSISVGPTNLLAPKNASPLSGGFDVFVQKVIPAIEASLGGLKGQRIAFGESFGGFSAVQLALRTDLFDKLAAVCTPMTTDLTPFSTPAQVEAHVRASPVYRFLGAGSLAMLNKTQQDSLNTLKSYFPTLADWQQADPLMLAANASSQRHFMAVHVEAGYHDTLALYQGNENFVLRLNAHGLQMDWRPQSGGHCDVDIASLADFLAF
jgi:hypothetical protein